MSMNGEITLTVSRAGEESRTLSFSKGVVVIGRQPGCDLQVEDQAVGREHAKLEFTSEGGLRVVDLGTSLGTALNGNRISGSILVNNGDVLDVGPMKIVVSFKSGQKPIPKGFASQEAWKKYENPRRPVINVAQIWGDTLYSVQRFGPHYRQKVHALIFTTLLLGLQGFILWSFHQGLFASYQDGTLDMTAYAAANMTGVIYSALCCLVADIGIFFFIKELFVPARAEQGKNIMVGPTLKADFFLPEELVGPRDYKLMVKRNGRSCLDLGNEKIGGQILYKGETMELDSVRKSSLLQAGRFLPLELGTRARLTIGEFTFVLSMEPSMYEPKGRTISQFSMSSAAYFVLAFFIHALFMLALMVTPSGETMEMYTSETPRLLQTVIRVQKRELALEQERQKEEEKKKKNEEKKEEVKEEEKTEEAKVEKAPEAKQEEAKRAETMVLKTEPKKDEGLKKTLKLESTGKKRNLTTTVVSRDSVKDKGALGALTSLRSGAISSDFGVEMNVNVGKMLGEARLDDLGEDIYKNMGGGSDSDPFELASAGGGGGGEGGAGGAPGSGVGGGIGFDTSVGVDGADIQGGVKGAPIVLGGGQDIAELQKDSINKNTKAPQFREKQVKIMPKDIQMDGGGKLDKETVKSHIRKQLGGIRWCYQKGYQKNPNLEGKVTVRFVISATGKVIGAEIMKSTLGDAEVEQCIEQKILTWRFPEPKGGIIKVVYPFVLRRQ